MQGHEQIAEIGRLRQQAAAALVGMSARNFRDCADVPRNDDGTYDGRALVQWHAQRMGDTVEFTDDEVEQLLLVAGLALDDEADHAVLIEVLEGHAVKYGEAGLFSAFKVLLESWREQAMGHVDEHGWPSEARPMTRAQERIAVDRMRERHEERRARWQLRIAIVCESCRRVRRGFKWERRMKHTAGLVKLNSLCPDCNARERR